MKLIPAHAHSTSGLGAKFTKAREAEAFGKQAEVHVLGFVAARPSV